MADREKVRTLSVEFAGALLSARSGDGNGRASEGNGRRSDRGAAAEALELSDLDSFTIVEMLVALEDAFGVPLLQEIGTFNGGTFEELADFVVQCSREAETSEKG